LPPREGLKQWPQQKLRIDHRRCASFCLPSPGSNESGFPVTVSDLSAPDQHNPEQRPAGSPLKVYHIKDGFSTTAEGPENRKAPRQHVTSLPGIVLSCQLFIEE